MHLTPAGRPVARTIGIHAWGGWPIKPIYTFTENPLALARAQAYRRAQWAPVRVEAELRKLQHQRPELGQLVPPPSLDHRKAGGAAADLP